jgi:WXG100 family type VII secretion target
MSDMPIVVDYAALEEAASTIQTASRTIEEKLSELDGQLKKITWEGNDRQAYMANKSKWDQAVADMNQILAQISGAVTTAREGYGATEKAGQDAWA